jgi:hypothetical protein
VCMREELDRLLKNLDVGLGHSKSAQRMELSTIKDLGHIGFGSSEPMFDIGPLPHKVPSLPGQSKGMFLIN